MLVRPTGLKLGLATGVLTLCSLSWAAPWGGKPDHETRRSQAGKLLQDGNWKEAFELLSELALEQDNDPRQVGGDLHRAVSCLQQLGRVNEIDDLCEKVINHSKQSCNIVRVFQQQIVFLIRRVENAIRAIAHMSREAFIVQCVEHIVSCRVNRDFLGPEFAMLCIAYVPYLMQKIIKDVIGIAMPVRSAYVNHNPLPQERTCGNVRREIDGHI